MRRTGIYLTVLIWLLIVVPTTRAAVDLLYFLPVPASNHILLTWETAQELDNAGFYIQRSDTVDGTFVRISGFIASLDPFVGHYYEYDDLTPAVGVTYFYKLEAVDSGGNSAYYGPVAAMVTAATLTPTVTATGQIPATGTTTPTATATATLVSTPTSTTASTVGAATSTATPTTRPASTSTPRPSSSPAPSPTTANPISSATHTALPTREFTPTLEPLPEINLVFPAFTSTPVFDPTQTPTFRITDASDRVSTPPGIPPRLVFLGLVVLVLWLALMGFAIFYSRHSRG